jgi:hypothetical protein
VFSNDGLVYSKLSVSEEGLCAMNLGNRLDEMLFEANLILTIILLFILELPMFT